MMSSNQTKKTKCFWRLIIFLNFFILLEAIALIAGIVSTWRSEKVFSQLKLIFCIYSFIFLCNSILGIFGLKNKRSFVLFFAITLMICRVFFLVVVFFIIFRRKDSQYFVDSHFPDSTDYINYIYDVLNKFGEWPKIGYAIYMGITLVYLPIIFCYRSSLGKFKRETRQRNEEITT